MQDSCATGAIKIKELWYVPIIHAEADLGGVAAEVDKKGISLCGKERWEKHKRTIAAFWEEISEYFAQFKSESFKIYQDGLVADGEMGMKIVTDGVKSGSKNYEIINHLIEKGAALVKTEDLDIVMKEYKAVKELAKAKTFIRKILAYLKHVCCKNRILEERDRYIAKRIGETLKEKETGILFIGAQHNVIDKLPGDIKVIALKDREKVLKYMKEYCFGSKKGIDELAEYLKDPIWT